MIHGVETRKSSKMTSPKRFITKYTSDETDRLALRANNGIRSNKYRQVDYDKLKLLAAEKKFSAHKTLLKVKKIEEISKQSKENTLLKQHKHVWNKEFIRLNNLKKRIQADVDLHRRLNSTEGSGCCRAYQTFDDYEASLDDDFGDFKTNTTEPVWNLREDLQFWLGENMEDLRLGSPNVVEKHAEICETVNNVKSQQHQLLQQLEHEQQYLEAELQSGSLWEITHGPVEDEPHIEFAEGIPEEAFDLPCSDDELKVSVLQEFIIIDQKFRERLHFLEDEHAKILSKGRHGGWTEKDHYQFVVVYEQYPHEMKNRRKLIMDRLKRHLPNRSRHDMVLHEEWCEANKYFHERKRALAIAWKKGRAELFIKAKGIFTEADIAAEVAEVKAEYTKKQKQLSEALYDKIRIWREQKMEAMMIQQQIEERRQEELSEKLKLEAEKEKKRRTEEKQRIDKFHEEKNEIRRQEEEHDRKRLEELNEMMQQQAIVDRERVKYREEMLEQKIQEQAKKIERKEKEEREKEKRLEALREQVRVIAESDPDRLFQETKAWQARFNEEEEDIMIQKPLFEIHGFTSEQVTSDPRMKLENRLREAGLHKSNYARQILSNVKPLHPPRKDMESTVFKQDQQNF